MGQSKGTSLKSIKLLCFSLFQSCTEAQRGRFWVSVIWIRNSFAVPLPFKITVVQKLTHGWKMNFEKTQNLGKKPPFDHSNRQRQNQHFSGWYLCQALFIWTKAQISSLSLCSRHAENICLIIRLFEEAKNFSYLLITWHSLVKTVMRIFIIRQQKWEVILLVCWTEGIWCTLIYDFTLHWFNNTYFDIFCII